MCFLCFTWNICLLPPHQQKKDADIVRTHSGNAACLGNSGRADRGKLLTRFRRKRLNRHIVEIIRKPHRLQTMQFVSHLPLAADITIIFDFYLDRFSQFMAEYRLFFIGIQTLYRRKGRIKDRLKFRILID